MNQIESLPAPLMNLVEKVSGDYQLTVGVVEVALGSALLAYGVSNALPEMEKLCVRFVDPPDTWKTILGGTGVSTGSLLHLIGNIGVVAMGSGFAIPAVVLAAGGAVTLGSLGHFAGSWIDELLIPDTELWSLVLDAGFVVIGGGLIVDGLRRMWKEVADGKPEPHLIQRNNEAEHGLGLGRHLLTEFYAEPHLADEFRATLGGFTLARLVGRSTADMIATLKGKQSKYESTCRSALCHAIMGKANHAFGALRIASSVNDDYARHHHIYGLIHAVEGRPDEARIELARALKTEPNAETRYRIKSALNAL